MNDLTLIIPAKREAESLPIFLKEIENYECKKLIVLQKEDIETKKSIENIQNLTFNTQVWEKLQSILKDHSIYAFTPHGLLPDSDLHGRMFAPEIGITEDPATGSANGPLACYLFKYGIKKGPLISEQGFEMNRPSILHIEIESEKEIIKKWQIVL